MVIKAIKAVKARFEGGLRGESDEGGCKGSMASEARSGGAEESQPGSTGAVGKTELTSGPHVSAGG
jgi:hypothetical protein